MVVSAGWYIALVSLWPADSRPYIGGLHRQQPAAAGVGLQRDSTHRRWRRRSRRWRPRRSGLRRRQPVLRRPIGYRPTVRPVDGRRSVLAAARGADRPCGGYLVHPAYGAYRNRPRRTAAVGRLAAGDRRGVQLHGRHGAPVLHGGAGARDRGAGRDLGARSCGRAGNSSCRGSCWRSCLAATGVWAFILLDRTPDWLPALRWIVLAGSVVVAAIVRRRVPSTGPCGGRTRRRRSAFRPGRAYRVRDLQRRA